MFVSTDIEINEDEMAEAVTSSRYFTDAVESVVQDMDLQQQVEDTLDAMGVPSEDRVDDIAREAARDEIRDAEFMAEDDVDDLVRSILRDEGLLRGSQVTLQAQARIEGLEERILMVATAEDAEARMSDLHARVVDLEKQVATLRDTLANVAVALGGVEVDTDAVSIAMTQADVEPAKAGQVLDTLERPTTFSGIY